MAPGPRNSLASAKAKPGQRSCRLARPARLGLPPRQQFQDTPGIDPADLFEDLKCPQFAQLMWRRVALSNRSQDTLDAVTGFQRQAGVFVDSAENRRGGTSLRFELPRRPLTHGKAIIVQLGHKFDDASPV